MSTFFVNTDRKPLSPLNSHFCKLAYSKIMIIFGFFCLLLLDIWEIINVSFIIHTRNLHFKELTLLCNWSDCPSMLNVHVQPFSHIFCRQITTNPLHFKLHEFFLFFFALFPLFPPFFLLSVRGEKSLKLSSDMS